MLRDRRLDWEGCCNVRDLGGLRTAAGGETRWGAVVRADAVDRLSAAGWAALEAYGVRTVVDLRNDDELATDVAGRPVALRTVHLALDGVEDKEFWDEWASGPQFGTPLYYGPFLERFPQRTAAVLAAIARARPGGVLIHCGGGRDRTGLISILLLALAGVPPEEIAADYALGAAGAAGGETPELEAFLARAGTSARDLVVALLERLDVAAYLREAGLTEGDLAALRNRLVAPPHALPSPPERRT